ITSTWPPQRRMASPSASHSAKARRGFDGARAPERKFAPPRMCQLEWGYDIRKVAPMGPTLSRGSDGSKGHAGERPRYSAAPTKGKEAALAGLPPSSITPSLKGWLAPESTPHVQSITS